MSKYKIKVKINDYFPKIDAIPFENYICLISCNNCYSKIKLTEYKYQFFQHSFELIKNTDMLFNIKLISYIEKNTLIGIYDLLIPYTKVNQILQRNNSFYQQQIKLIMNSNVKIKLFGTMMNITSIYLDLIFEMSLIENYTPSINKLRIYDIIGNQNFEEIMNNHNNKKKKTSISNLNENVNINFHKNKIAKSPNFNYNNFINDFYENVQNTNKDNFNNYHFNDNSTNKEKHSDINYNVMNNNYLNYFKIDNNNFPVNYKINMNNKSPINISKNNLNINNIETNATNSNKPNNNIYIKLNNINNLSVPREKNYVKINDNKINIKGFKKNKNIARSPHLMHSQRNSYLDESNKYIKKSRNKNLTEVKNSIETDIIRNEKKKLELNQAKKIIKLKNNDNRIIKFNDSNKLNYNNYIKTKKPILYDKKIHLQIFNNRLRKKIPNSNKCFQNKKSDEKDNSKLDIIENKMNLSELKPYKAVNYNKITPKKKKTDSNSFLIDENENNPFTINISNIKNTKENANESNKIDDKRLSTGKGKIKNNIPFHNSNYKNLKNCFNSNLETEKKQEMNNIENINTKEDNKYEKINNLEINKKESDKNIDKNFNGLEKNKNICSSNNNLTLIDNNNLNKNIEDKNIVYKNILENIENKNIVESNVSNANIKDANDIMNKITYTPEDLKNKALESIDTNNKLGKEIKNKINSNYKLYKKLLLLKEKYYTELKINNRLNKNINLKDIKYLIHVNVRSKLNEKLYFNMKKIKQKEFKIFEKIFYENKNSPEYKAKEAKRKIQEKLEQQKKVHALLKIIRELIQKYENLSQLYKDDEKKKLLFKSLLVRYGIREKEESKENNLMEKFKEIQKKMEQEKNNNLMKIKNREMQNDVFKNVIKEESDEERSSISERMLKRGYSLKKKLSWASEDSVFKEKENLETNKSNNDDFNNSLLSSGLKIIKENKEEDLVKENNNNNNNEEENLAKENNNEEDIKDSSNK